MSQWPRRKANPPSAPPSSQPASEPTCGCEGLWHDLEISIGPEARDSYSRTGHLPNCAVPALPDSESTNTFAAFVPSVQERRTIAQEILATTAAMKKAGTFENNALCWNPWQLELLAMFAIDAKYQINGLHAYIDGIEGYLGEKRPSASALPDSDTRPPSETPGKPPVSGDTTKELEKAIDALLETKELCVLGNDMLPQQEAVAAARAALVALYNRQREEIAALEARCATDVDIIADYVRRCEAMLGELDRKREEIGSLTKRLTNSMLEATALRGFKHESDRLEAELQRQRETTLAEVASLSSQIERLKEDSARMARWILGGGQFVDSFLEISEVARRLSNPDTLK